MSLIARIDEFIYRRLTRAWPAGKVAAYTDRVVAANDGVRVPPAVREQFVMIVEIMLYLLVAIACLRCSSLFREATEDSVGDGSMERELILRRELFIFCNTTTIYLTILVLVTLPIVLYL